MNTLHRLRTNVARAILPRNQVITTSQQLDDYFRRTDDPTVPAVTSTRAMQHSTVSACVRLLSEDIASLPLILYKRVGKNKERVTDGWLFELLQKPNLWQTGFEFRELQQSHLEVFGNFYALMTVVRDEIREMIPVHPDRVRPKQADNGAVTYDVNLPNGVNITAPEDRMYHVRGPSIDGVTGASPLDLHRYAIQFGMQMTEYGTRMFKNGALIGGVLQHDAQLSDTAYERLKKDFDEKYSGVSNIGKTVLLEEGTKFNPTGMKAVDAQFLESRKYNRSEICGIYRVPPHLVADLERATFSNIEEQARGYVQYGILPRIRRIESRMALSLLPLSMRPGFVLEHLVEGMLRARSSERFTMYQSAVATGWMNRNEVRALENLNPGPAELDEYLEPQFLTGAPTNGSQDSLTEPDEKGAEK